MDVRRDVLHQLDRQRRPGVAARHERRVLFEFRHGRQRIGQARPHVVQQQIAEESGRRANVANMADRAAQLLKQHLAPLSRLRQ